MNWRPSTRELLAVTEEDVQSARFRQQLAWAQLNVDTSRRPEEVYWLLHSRRRTSGKSVSISSWREFWDVLVNDPKNAGHWLANSWKIRGYLWYDTYFDDQWRLDELKIHWESWQLGIKSGALTNCFVRVESERKKHGQPPERFFLSHQSLGTESYVHFLERITRELVRNRLVLTAVALARFQVAEGEYPEALDKLVPTFLDRVPADPIDGQPLRYRRLDAEEFELWSVGKDGIDNNGDGSIPVGPGPLRWHNAADWIWPRQADDVEINAGSKKEADRP